MGYFKSVSLILGGLSVLYVLLFYLLPKKLPDFILTNAYPATKPGWINPICLLIVVWVLFTWYQFFRFPSPLTFIISLFLMFGLLKIALLTSNYEQMRAIVVELLTQNRVALHIVLISSLVLGIGILLIGFML